MIDERQETLIRAACASDSPDSLSDAMGGFREAEMGFARPLQWAAESGALRCLRLLLEMGFGPGRADASGRTPLMAACQGGRAECAAVLAVAGAPVNATDDDGRDALMDAALAGSIACASMLIEAGADPGRRDFQGWTALDWARVQGHEHVAAFIEGKFDAMRERAELEGVAARSAKGGGATL